jgi:hypothetical protein
VTLLFTISWLACVRLSKPRVETVSTRSSESGSGQPEYQKLRFFSSCWSAGDSGLDDD